MIYYHDLTTHMPSQTQTGQCRLPNPRQTPWSTFRIHGCIITYKKYCVRLNRYNIVVTIQVQKRDGSLEEFIPEKIIRVLLAAGLEEDSALIVASNVADWATSQPSPTLTSLQIRDQVLIELDKVDPYIAGLFRWYQKSKDQSRP